MLRHSFEKTYHTLNTVFISESSIRHNLHLFRKLLPQQSICPVLKSNAYGHDLILTAKILAKEKLDFLIVDSLYEAYELREANILSPILVMGYNLPQNLKRPHPDFHFAVFDMNTARILAKHKTPVHLKIETGLNRMGFSLTELKQNLKKMKRIQLNVVGVFTHLADADNPTTDKYSKAQIKVFREALKMIRAAGFNPQWIHVAASGGALKVNIPEANMVRLGISLFGINPYLPQDPFYKKLKELKPSLELQSTLITIRTLQKGEKVGYAGTFVARKKMTVGVVPIGYYEALPRHLSGQGYVEIRKKSCPILGRISMNYVMVDLKDVKAKYYDPVTVYSCDPKKPNSITNIAKLAGTLPNEILVRICESLLRTVR